MIRFVNSHVDLAGLIADAREEGRTVCRIEGLAAKGETIAAFGSALGFPSWSGRNLDALADSLSDLLSGAPGPYEIIWDHSERLADADPTAYEGIVEVLTDVTAGHDGTQVTVIDRALGG